MADSQEPAEGVQQLQEKIEQIYLEYQKVLTAEESMAPKDINKKISDGSENNNSDEDDLVEIETVSENIDILNSALDSIEAQTDRIRNQLLELLASNREVRQFIREENEKLSEPSNDNDNDAKNVNNESASD